MNGNFPQILKTFEATEKTGASKQHIPVHKTCSTDDYNGEKCVNVKYNIHNFHGNWVLRVVPKQNCQMY